MTIHPGNPAIKADSSYEVHEHTAVSPLDTFLDVIRNMYVLNVSKTLNTICFFANNDCFYVPGKRDSSKF